MKRNVMITTSLLALATLAASPSTAQDFSEGWKFIKKETSPSAPITGWENITIPHTWNALDAQNGGGKDKHSRDGYYRGPASYAKSFLAPPSLQGKRIFLRFEAVSTVAEVYLNGQRLGEHKGGFGAFAFEITDHIKLGRKNDLRLMASNAWNAMIPPLAGDFPIFGGIYRPVSLLVKEPICISPLRNGSHGVFLRQQDVSESSATLNVTTLLDNAKNHEARTILTYELIGTDGNVVAKATDQQQIKAGAEAESTATLKLANPHLWNGRADPYLYTVRVNVSEKGKPVDSFTMKQGFRYFHVDPDNGFFLNGKPYQLWGVNRHQDQEDKGWALTEEDHRLDIDIIYEMGTRSIRLAHYPHAETIFELCDEMGILVTAELPLVDCITDAPEFEENTVQQVKEIVDLQGNHSCVFAYGIYNEMYQRESPPAETLLLEMHELFKRLDPTRYTYGATNKGGRMDLNRTTELLAFNGYLGWYRGASAEMKNHVASYLKASEGRGIACSEYGAGASIKQHETRAQKPVAKGKWHPEEYQAMHHEIQFEIMKRHPAVWGTYVWNMFDFASVWRDEGDRPGINDKGLVTRDRKTRKDAFFFYKANWSEEPVLYITSRRHTTRSETDTPIKVYSNQGSVTLTVNGKKVGTKEPTDMRIALWDNVALKKGDNIIEITAGDQKDTCLWTVVPTMKMKEK
ncbi:glycoside hydrolase family 2 TIM barrel-domain containing protein [Pontiellaceae bacterium B12227]|nr:glycoside hydrolase family 2 TIM barrel-domain containing protein [Pontiellaceae bacterium B12227]